MERTRRRTLESIGAVAAGLSIAGCLGSDDGDENGTGTNGEGQGTATGTPGDHGADLNGAVGQMPDYLKLTEYATFVTGDTEGVSGTVRNTGDRPLKNVKAEVALRDSDNVVVEEKVVESSEEEIERLEPEGTWQFKVTFEGENLSDAAGFIVSADGSVARRTDA